MLCCKADNASSKLRRRRAKLKVTCSLQLRTMPGKQEGVYSKCIRASEYETGAHRSFNEFFVLVLAVVAAAAERGGGGGACGVHKFLPFNNQESNDAGFPSQSQQGSKRHLYSPEPSEKRGVQDIRVGSNELWVFIWTKTSSKTRIPGFSH